jgi:hypothetical protein
MDTITASETPVIGTERGLTNIEAQAMMLLIKE